MKHFLLSLSLLLVGSASFANSVLVTEGYLVAVKVSTLYNPENPVEETFLYNPLETSGNKNCSLKIPTYDKSINREGFVSPGLVLNLGKETFFGCSEKSRNSRKYCETRYEISNRDLNLTGSLSCLHFGWRAGKIEVTRENIKTLSGGTLSIR